MISRPSRSACTASFGVRRGPPAATTASQNAPAPIPSSIRPRLSRSRLATVLASTNGGRSGRLVTLAVSRSEVVRAAMVPISAQASRNRAWYGWSWMVASSNPAASVSSAELDHPVGLARVRGEEGAELEILAVVGHRRILSGAREGDSQPRSRTDLPPCRRPPRTSRARAAGSGSLGCGRPFPCLVLGRVCDDLNQRSARLAAGPFWVERRDGGCGVPAGSRAGGAEICLLRGLSERRVRLLYREGRSGRWIRTSFLLTLPRKRVAAAHSSATNTVESAWSKATTDRTGTFRAAPSRSDESPASGCEREIREELGLDLTVGRLLCVGWVQESHDEHGGLQFIYDGGVLDATTISRIVLPADELTDHRFVSVEAAASLVSQRNLDRLRAALDAIANGGVAELDRTVSDSSGSS